MESEVKEMRYLLIIVIIIAVWMWTSSTISKGIPTGSEQYNEIARQKNETRKKQLMEGEKMATMQNLRFLMWSYNEVVLENGAILTLGQLSRYGLVIKIDYNMVTCDNDGVKYRIFRNDLMMSNVTTQDENEKSITNKMIEKTKGK